MARIIDFFSLQVVAGACISATFISRLYNQVTPLVSFVCLGLSVLIIYSVDHYWDSSKASSAKQRHIISPNKIASVKLTIVIATIINVFFIFYLSWSTLIAGMVIGSLVATYFLLFRNAGKPYWIFKEFLIALIFTFGIFIPGVTAGQQVNVSLSAVFLFLEFFLLAWTNLLIFSWFDFEYDKKSGFPSGVRVLGKPLSKNIIYILIALFMIVWLLHFILIPDFPVKNRIITFLMAIILAAIMFNHRYFAKSDRYRFIGDAIFLLPLLAWI